jgi:alpha-tubulin suppressor-like RCC1 family protein
LFCFGSNNEGQLGTGDNMSTNVPIELKFFENEKLKEITCQNSFTFAICGISILLKFSDKKVFSWGLNNRGQLGHGNTNNKNTPTKVDFFDGKNILQISTGFQHCLALEGLVFFIESIDNGNIYSWGDNSCGQLGNNTTIDELKPILIHKNLNGVERIFCGVRHSTILQNGEILICGGNKMCQLGLGDTIDRLSFEKMKLPDKIKKFHTSGHHSLVLLG